MSIFRELQTPGDLVYSLGEDGTVRAWFVESDGTLRELNPAVAQDIARANGGD